MAKTPVHGTSARYQKHMRDQERPCEECSRAHTRAMREWRAEQLEAEGWVLKATHPGYPHSIRIYEHPDNGLKAVKI